MFVIQPFEYARIPETASIVEADGRGVRRIQDKEEEKRGEERRRDTSHPLTLPVVSSGQTNCLVLKAARTKRAWRSLLAYPARLPASPSLMVAADI